MSTIVLYAVAILLVGLMTFGQDVPAAYSIWVRDAIQFFGAMLLFAMDPKAFLTRVETVVGTSISHPPVVTKVETPPTVVTTKVEHPGEKFTVVSPAEPEIAEPAHKITYVPTSAARTIPTNRPPG